MANFRLLCYFVLSLAVLQAGCTSVPRAYAIRSSSIEPVATCDDFVRYIDVVVRVANTSGKDVEFNLDGNRGPPFDLWWLGYRVHSSPPGQFLKLTHNSGHDSVWTRTIAVAPGDSADFHTPIFGLRPSDYRNHFRIELRDARGRSIWTPEFSLCSVSKAMCSCPVPAS